jgi:uncharacterized protein
MAHDNADTLYRDLLSEIEGIKAVDAHEHLPTEESYIAKPADFYTLFEHYCRADLVAAGARDGDLKQWGDRSRPSSERWTSFAPYLSRIRTGGYARAALLVVRDILGIPDLTEDTYEEVGRALSELHRPGLYDEILRERCGLAACIQCWHLGEAGPDYFYHLAPSPEVVDVASRDAANALAARCDLPVHTLDDVLRCMTKTVERWRADPGVVGIKSAHAYRRSIAFQRVERCTAERVFNDIMRVEGHSLSPSQVLPLQDYLMFELFARAEAAGLPMVFHTGLQAGNFGRIADANPLHLQPLLEEFPRARIDLFHAGMPFTREIGVLAKYFPGVHLNMAWTHVINPAMARAALEEWLDMVPNTKIFGFGGDYAIVEKVYGHLVLARRNVARVLAGKVAEGAFSRTEASLVARRIMRDNAAEFYRLPLGS